MKKFKLNLIQEHTGDNHLCPCCGHPITIWESSKDPTKLEIIFGLRSVDVGGSATKGWRCCQCQALIVVERLLPSAEGERFPTMEDE